jgi:hypothetical protein
MPKDEKEIIDGPEDIKEVDDRQMDRLPDKDERKVHNKSHFGLMTVWIFVGALLIVAIIGMTSNMFIARNHSEFASRPSFTTTFVEHGGGSRMMGGMFVDNSSNSDTNTTTTSITSGVVISVKSNSFIIAGNGNQYTVNTTSDTTYNTSDKKVAVNDSVIVVGAISSSKTITATDVRVSNL